jgi:tellurite resistance protein
MRVPLPAAMITTLSAMRMSRNKTSIISGLLCGLMCLLITALSGCGAVRLAYNNAPVLAWWEVDSYFDFSREQAPAVKASIDSFFDWHRSTQLPDYVALLSSAQASLLDTTTPAAACGWQARVTDALEPSIDKLLVQSADLVPGLSEAQFKHLEGRYTKVIDEMRKEFLQPDAAKRMAKSVKRAQDRAEMLYGSLDAAQIKVIKEGVLASAFNPEAWLAERQRRQRDVVQTLRQLVADKADSDKRLAALRALVARQQRSPDPTYRAYQVKLADYNCTLAAQIHNATTAAQRKKAQQNLKGWEEDLRAVMAAPGPGS